jgi:DNA-binding transcriptional LysR family regulator
VLVPPAIAAFRAAHPGVALTLEEAEPAAAADGLRDGRYDVAVVFEYDFAEMLDPAGLVLHPLQPDEMLVALPPAHPLAGADPVPLEALATETWIASQDPGCKRLLDHGAAQAGFTPKVAFASDDYGAVGRLVLAGVGIALVPALAAPAVGDAVVLRRPAPAPGRRISAAVPAAPSAAAAALVAILTSGSDRSTSSAPAGATA